MWSTCCLRRSASTSSEANGGSFEIGPQDAQSRLLATRNAKRQRTHILRAGSQGASAHLHVQAKVVSRVSRQPCGVSAVRLIRAAGRPTLFLVWLFPLPDLAPSDTPSSNSCWYGSDKAGLGIRFCRDVAT